MKERAIQFGPERRLLGILSLPTQPDPERPALILPNTGFEHRAGPNRLHVHLARAFAQAGYVALRLDLSGLGDSGTPRELGTQDPVADLGSAMDELQRIGLARRCVPLGLCSGGNDAHRFAKADERVAGAAFLDHYLYATPRSRSISLAQKVTDPKRIIGFLERKLRELAPAEGEAYAVDESSYFEQPEQAVFCEDLAGFMARGLPLFFLFSGEYQQVYNYPEQLHEVCPPLRDYPLHQLHYFADADHTFTRAQMRARLIEALCAWLDGGVLGAEGALPPTAAQWRPMASAANT
ncbi:MAG TPA: hypothetical protein VGE47_07845 [Burkholderiaceae bacterium]